jgi:hypothetical protein
MVWDRIKSIFTKEKKFAIYVADRGKKIKVGVVEAKDHSELSDKIIALLEDKPEYHEYPRIHIIDLGTGESIRLKNPFTEETSSSEEAPKRSKSSSINPAEIESMLRNALELQGSMYKTILQSMFNDVIELAKDLVKVRVGLTQPQPQEKTTLKDIAQLTTSLVWLIQNWDKVNTVLKEANISALLGGQLGQLGQLNTNISKEGGKK